MLSALECLVVLFCLLALAALFVVRLHSFLAVTAPIKANVLVVEGWLPDYALVEVAAEFRQGGYQKIFVVGGPLRHGYFLTQYKSFAHLAAATLTVLGIEAEKIVAIPMPLAVRDRTKTAALLLRQWLFSNGAEIQAVNLYSLGPHARRSWLAFKQVLQPEIRVGIIAGLPQDYEPDRWWEYSAGVRMVLSELIGYGYACLPQFATPRQSAHHEEE